MEKLTAFFTTISLIFTYLFGFGTITVSDGYNLEKQQKLNSIVSMTSAQGLCCDGEYFYCSGALAAINFTGLGKYDLNMKKIKLNFNAIPKEFTEKYGSNHIGGIDCTNGIIYGPAEGKLDGEYKYNLVMLFDAETLEFTGKYYDVSNEYLTDGIPWLAIDKESGILYTSQFNNVDKILKYNLEDMSYLGYLPISQKINRIQGGSVYEGKLYLSYDVAHSTNEQILAVDLESGNVSQEFEISITNYDNEAEDICVYPLADGTLFHALEYDKLINVNILHISKEDK